MGENFNRCKFAISMKIFFWKIFRLQNFECWMCIETQNFQTTLSLNSEEIIFSPVKFWWLGQKWWRLIVSEQLKYKYIFEMLSSIRFFSNPIPFLIAHNTKQIHHSNSTTNIPKHNIDRILTRAWKRYYSNIIVNSWVISNGQSHNLPHNQCSKP